MQRTASATVISRDRTGKTHEVSVGQLCWRPSTYGIVIHDSRILLVKEDNGYHLPGGGLELGEDLKEGVVREVEEETGITVTAPRLLECVSSFFSCEDVDSGELQHVQSLLFYFQCQAVDIDATLSTDKLDDYERLVGHTPEWVALDQLDDIVVGTTVDWRPIVKAAAVTR